MMVFNSSLPHEYKSPNLPPITGIILESPFESSAKVQGDLFTLPPRAGSTLCKSRLSRAPLSQKGKSSHNHDGEEMRPLGQVSSTKDVFATLPLAVSSKVRNSFSHFRKEIKIRINCCSTRTVSRPWGRTGRLRRWI